MEDAMDKTKFHSLMDQIEHKIENVVADASENMRDISDEVRSLKSALDDVSSAVDNIEGASDNDQDTIESLPNTIMDEIVDLIEEAVNSASLNVEAKGALSAAFNAIISQFTNLGLAISNMITVLRDLGVEVPHAPGIEEVPHA